MSQVSVAGTQPAWLCWVERPWGAGGDDWWAEYQSGSQTEMVAWAVKGRQGGVNLGTSQTR